MLTTQTAGLARVRTPSLDMRTVFLFALVGMIFAAALFSALTNPAGIGSDAATIVAGL